MKVTAEQLQAINGRLLPLIRLSSCVVLGRVVGGQAEILDWGAQRTLEMVWPVRGNGRLFSASGTSQYRHFRAPIAATVCDFEEWITETPAPFNWGTINR